MISEEQAKRYCSEDISLIENYERAVADQTQAWDIHHKAEILPCGIYAIKNLKDHGLYYKQPAARLVFMTRSEHSRLHNKGKRLSDETRHRMSEALKGRQFSEETRRRMSEAKKGKRLSEETKSKLSEALKGRPNGWAGKHRSEETKRKMSEALKGRPKSEETKRKLSEALKGRHFSDEHRQKLSEAWKRRKEESHGKKARHIG